MPTAAWRMPVSGEYFHHRGCRSGARQTLASIQEDHDATVDLIPNSAERSLPHFLSAVWQKT
jgi:hypothetical protein